MFCSGSRLSMLTGKKNLNKTNMYTLADLTLDSSAGVCVHLSGGINPPTESSLRQDAGDAQWKALMAPRIPASSLPAADLNFTADNRAETVSGSADGISVSSVVCGDSLGCGTAGYEDLDDGVAAQAVAAVDAAGDFAGCVQAFDRIAVLIKDMAVGIDLDAAHGVVC